MFPAEPIDFQRLTVVLVVHLSLGAADAARLLDDIAAALVGSGIASASILVGLDWRQWMAFTPLPHITGMAIGAPIMLAAV